MENNITIEQVSYENSKQVRVLQACLETWFKDPKDLNLTAPQMNYPFNFKKWIADSYSKANTRSFILKNEKWIIGYASLQLQPKNDYVHLFHVFVDRSFRGKGYSKLLVQKATKFAKRNNIPAVTLFVNPNNQLAINLYESFGFKEIGFSNSGSLRMRLEVA